MYSSVWSRVAKLRDVLHLVERDLGLDHLTPNERDILLAFYANASPEPEIGLVSTTERVLSHPTVKRISQPTFHRTLRKLLAKGLIRQTETCPVGTYLLPLDA